MIDVLRQEIAATADTWVVKVGTRVLTRADGTFDEEGVVTLAEQIHHVMESGRQIVLVSSGAVGAGMGRLGLDSRPHDLAQLQAVAAVGQSHLVQAYDRALSGHHRHAAQILLTTDDLDHRTRYLNIRNTLRASLRLGAVPIINENDTVSVDELQTTFGDNDRLAAMVTNLLRAPLLVLLSDVAGLFDGDPSDAAARVVPTLKQVDEAALAMVCDEGADLSKGGMRSKLEAARIATTAGENVIIAAGREPRILERIMAGEVTGTLCLAQGQPLAAWKRWIGYTAQPRGRLVLDAGARRAIEADGRSLLAIGIVRVEGRFSKGDVVALADDSGVEFARGLTNYPAGEVARIQGLPSRQIVGALGHCPYEEVIHRDNMVVTS